MHTSPKPLRDAALLERFIPLSSYLDTHRYLWEPRPFQLHNLPWEPQYPKLSAWLRALDEPTVETLELHTSALLHQPLPVSLQNALPSTFVQLLQTARQHTTIGPLLPPHIDPNTVVPNQRSRPPHAPNPLPYFWARSLATQVPQRKWLQLKHFLACVLHTTHTHTLPTSSHAVDWCAGKGHLGRTFAVHTQTPTFTLERNPALCSTAQTYADRLDAPILPVHLDVLTPASNTYLESAHTAFALHACGVLSTEFVRRTAHHDIPTIACAPCCHHALPVADTHYTPMSRTAQNHDLHLGHNALRLSIADEIVAPNRERRQRQHERIYRLGFDLLHRQATGQDRYTSLGTLPRAFWKLPFRTFCQHTAEHCQLALPSSWDAETTLRHAHELGHTTRSLGLVRALFRRPLDLWIVLDRAIFLHEAQRPVSLGTFCAPHLSPRNLMILSSHHTPTHRATHTP